MLALVNESARHQAKVGHSAVQELVKDIASGRGDLLRLWDQIHESEITSPNDLHAVPFVSLPRAGRVAWMMV